MITVIKISLFFMSFDLENHQCLILILIRIQCYVEPKQYKMLQFEPLQTKTLTLPISLNQKGTIYPFVTPLGPF